MLALNDLNISTDMTRVFWKLTKPCRKLKMGGIPLRTMEEKHNNYSSVTKLMYSDIKLMI